VIIKIKTGCLLVLISFGTEYRFAQSLSGNKSYLYFVFISDKVIQKIFILFNILFFKNDDSIYTPVNLN